MIRSRRSIGNKNIKPLKIAFICFHKNIEKYPKKWISEYKESILSQTNRSFDIFEISYGGEEERIFENSIFESKVQETHAHAHNYLLDKIFALGYDYVANSNIDDTYSPDRIEKQLKYMQRGYDIISSNFYNINEAGEVTHKMKMNDKNIVVEANKNHNIICHPVVCYSKHFWTTCTRLIPEEIPFDDFNLWKRSFGKYKFIILSDYLCSYRVHKFKVCNI